MNLSSLFRAQVQMVLMSLRCAMELASEIDGVIFSAYSELTRNVAIKLVPLSQLGEELIRMWFDASNACAAGRTGDAIIFLQCWLFWDCGRDKFRQAKKSRQAFAGMKRKKRGREVATSLLSGRRRLRVLFSVVNTCCGQGRRRSRDPTYIDMSHKLSCPELVVGKVFRLEKWINYRTRCKDSDTLIFVAIIAD